MTIQKRIFMAGVMLTLFATSLGQHPSIVKFDLNIPTPIRNAAVNSNGDVLLVDPVSDNVKEVRSGIIQREYLHPPYSRVVSAAFGPVDRRYLLFQEPGKLRVHVYDAAGQKISEVLANFGFSPVGFQVNFLGELLLLRDSNSASAGEPLIYKLDEAGNLVASFFPNPALPGAVRQDVPRLILGGNDEFAVFIPETRLVYWLDSNGNLIRTGAVASRMTAVGVVGGELWIAAASETVLPSSRPGVYAAKLTNPRLYRISKSGRTSELAIPAEMVGVTHIDGLGNLVRVTGRNISILSR